MLLENSTWQRFVEAFIQQWINHEDDDVRIYTRPNSARGHWARLAVERSLLALQEQAQEGQAFSGLSQLRGESESPTAVTHGASGVLAFGYRIALLSKCHVDLNNEKIHFNNMILSTSSHCDSLAL